MTRIITGGTVTIEDGVKAGQEYAPARKVIVTLHFEAPEDQAEITLDAVAALASKKVRELLGKQAVPSGAHSAKEPKPETAPQPVPEPEVVAAAKKRGPKAKATDKEALAQAAGVAGASTATADDLLGGDAPAATVVEEDPLALLEDKDEPVKEITDAELNRIVTEQIERFKSKDEAKRSAISVSIRKAMAERIGEGKPVQLRSIPQEKRAEFVEVIKRLT